MAVLLDRVQLERLRNGDEAIFGVVYEAFRTPIYIFCRRLVWNKEDAEDMVSSTFLKLWNKRADIEDSDHLTPLVYIIAKNTCIDFLRTSSRQKPRTPFIEDHADEFFESQSDPSWMLIHAERFKKLLELVNRTKKEIQEMPHEYGNVLRLFALEQKNPIQIANMLQISLETVKTHLVIARKHLRLKLQELGLLPNSIKKSTISYFVRLLHRNDI